MVLWQRSNFRLRKAFRSEVGKVIFLITNIVKNAGFKINKRKTKIQSADSGRRIITGVAIDNKGVHPTRRTLKKIRAAQHQNNTSSMLGLIEWSKCKLPGLPKPK